MILNETLQLLAYANNANLLENLISSYLLSKNIKINKIYKTTFFSVVLHGCMTSGMWGRGN
jgi:hypothetical protein